MERKYFLFIAVFLICFAFDEIFSNRLIQGQTHHELHVSEERVNYFSKYRFTRDVTLEITSKKLRYARDTAYLKRIGGYYMPLFEHYISRLDLPQELKYLPILESSLDMHALSHAGAGGLWQLMPTVGDQYNMVRNSFIDERYDPVRSTMAGLSYLKYLYNDFGDWLLALAAYNAGRTKVKRAIRKAGSYDFWVVRKYLPKETKAYVPSFLGLVNLFSDKKDFFGKLNLWSNTELIAVRQGVTFTQIAEVCKLPLRHIKILNSAYFQEVIPFEEGVVHTIRLPKNALRYAEEIAVAQQKNTNSKLLLFNL